MAETLEIPQQTQEGILPSPTNTQQPQQQYPPSKKLYDGLVEEKLYTKSYSEFQQQFSTPEAIGKLHDGLLQENLYTKDANDFQNQFFPDIQKKNPVGNVSQNGGGQTSPSVSQLGSAPQSSSTL